MSRFDAVIAAFDAANAADPNLMRVAGLNLPKELYYG